MFLRISIHALREESDDTIFSKCFNYGISIHALREESDLDGAELSVFSVISIHALREESDVAYWMWTAIRRNFNPRSP